MNEVKCVHCNKVFSHRKTLYVHVRNIHKRKPKLPTYRSNNSITCASCSTRVKFYSDLRQHMIEKHDVNIYKQEIDFQNKTDFYAWKSEKEKEMKCFYCKTSGVKTRKSYKKEYYVCHRSYVPEKCKNITRPPSKKGKTAQSTVKLSYSCPSTLEVIERDGTYKATLFFPHYGHGSSLKHINLSVLERAHIAGKIAEGVSFKRILDDIRNNINSDSQLERLHLLDRQDLRNITRDFNLRPQYHNNDAISVDLLVKHMQTLKDECPILFYKKQGTESDIKIFAETDFFLVIMTSFQETIAKKFASKKVCLDSTHGTTGYDFLLTTILTVDEFGEGVPIAFLLSNKADTPTLSYFFEVVKQKLGFILEVDVFMSDDAVEFYNAWSQIMKPPKHHLLCIWHVDKNWRANIQKKVEGDQELKASVYKQLRCLMETHNEEEFNDLLPQVINDLSVCESTKVFATYFTEFYSKRPHQWAFCFRKGLGINTNMFLESMHKVLKHIYLEGKKSKRVDKCIQALICLIRDLMFKRLKKVIKGKTSYRINLINISHKKGGTIQKEHILQVSEKCWKVKSTKDENEYIITKENTSCSESCQLICRLCNICVHIYTCSCLDNFIKGNICKHIHAICLHYNLGNSDYQKPQTSNVTEDDGGLLSVAAQHSKFQTSNTDINTRLKMKLDLLYTCFSENVYDESTSLKIEKSLNNILSIANTQKKSIKQSSKEPANKKVEKQLRFKTTKKKKEVTKNSFRKPTHTEKNDIKKCMEERKRIIENIKNDHSYV